MPQNAAMSKLTGRLPSVYPERQVIPWTSLGWVENIVEP